MATIDERFSGRESLERLEVFPGCVCSFPFYKRWELFRTARFCLLLPTRCGLYHSLACPVVVEGMVRYWL